MKIKIKATNITLTPAISAYLEKRLQAISKLTDPEDPTLLVEVEIGKTTEHHQSGKIFRAEINIQLGGKSFRAVSENNDLNSAIDEIRDEILDVLRAFKGKRISLLRRSGQRIKLFLRKFYK